MDNDRALLWIALRHCKEEHALSRMLTHLAKHPDDFQIRSELAYWYYRRGDRVSLALGLAHCEICLRHEVLWEHLYIKGLLLTRTGQLYDAFTLLHQVTELNPTFSSAACQLGHLCFFAGDYEQALGYYRLATTGEPVLPQLERHIAATEEALLSRRKQAP